MEAIPLDRFRRTSSSYWAPTREASQLGAPSDPGVPGHVEAVGEGAAKGIAGTGTATNGEESGQLKLKLKQSVKELAKLRAELARTKQGGNGPAPTHATAGGGGVAAAKALMSECKHK